MVGRRMRSTAKKGTYAKFLKVQNADSNQFLFWKLTFQVVSTSTLYQ